jgi:hypothetical protein
MEAELGVGREELLEQWARQLVRFHVLRAFAAWALLVKRPRMLVTVAAYGVPWLPAAAKALRVPVMELQHGVISSCHLAYHFPGVRPGSLRYFPDLLALWSPAWRRSAELPLDDTQISYLPLQALEDAKRAAGARAGRAGVLVVSQATIGARLAEFLEQQLPGDFPLPLRFRLHPREQQKWRQYRALVRLVEQGRVVLDGDGPIYPVLARTAAVIGCYSTALYEAVELGCRVYIAPLPGSEQLRGLLQAERVMMLDASGWSHLSATLRAARS